jgi:hypothetical protein
MKELFKNFHSILREKGVHAVILGDDCLMLTAIDAVIMIHEEKFVIYEYYYPIDFEIPVIGPRLGAIALADPRCFDQLAGFCHEITQTSRKEA